MKKEKLEQKQGMVRPPIVVVLGHVDHGKTTLLDYIRKTRVAAREAGGITQAIGAYQVETKEGKKMTFIDTPGHAAFAGMRARGAKAADIAVLVVAGDDGVMPQTKESVVFIREAELPFIVAITKIDKETVQVEKVKSQLAEEGVLLEGWGGNVPVCLVSGITGQGVEELLETIALLAEVEGVKGDEKGSLEAVVVEAKRTAARGPVATVIVRNGGLVVGEEVVAGKVEGRVRGIFNEWGKGVRTAGPGEPVEVLGWEGVPEVGSVVVESAKRKTSSFAPSTPSTLLRTSSLWASAGRQNAKVKEEGKGGTGAVVQQKEGLRLVVRTDTVGSLEAVMTNMPEGVVVLAAGVGEVVGADVERAILTIEEGKMKPVVVGFGVKVGEGVERSAEDKGIKILKFNLIYELLAKLAELSLKYMEPTIEEEVLGEAEIVAEFPFGKKRVAGCRVTLGRIAKGDRLHLKRGGEILRDCRIGSMRRLKEAVDKVEKGGEVGIVMAPQLDFKIGDVIVSFKA